MPTSPPPITALPTPPSTNSPATFAAQADAFIAAQVTFGPQVSAVGANAYDNAVDAAASASTASTAASTATSAATTASVTANAAAWVSGQTYALWANAISLLDGQTYRKITAAAGGVVDPKNNSTDWVRITAVAPGAGGTTITGSVTLTASSPAAMSVTPTAPGLYVTLPAATTMTKATAPFSIYNAGDYDYGVKDSAGTQLGWIKPRTGAVIGLADNSTAAGVWAPYGLEKVGITASLINSSLANMTSNYSPVRVAIDANRTCIVFGGTDCYAVVYDASSQTWGSPTLVRATVADAKYQAVLSAANQIMVVSCDASTGLEAVTLTISGVGITVNNANKASVASAASMNKLGQLAAVSTYWVFGYSTANPDSRVQAISISANTPTFIGTAQVLNSTAGASSSEAPQLYASGSIVRTLCGTNTNLLACKPFTVSGSGLSPGTEATATMTGSSTYRAFQNGNGNIVAHYNNTSHFAAIFKLTGTVEAVSTITIGAAPSSGATVYADCIPVTSAKTLFVWLGGSNWYAAIVTDTAGTASVGTTLTTAFIIPSPGSIRAVAVTSNNARVLVGSASAILAQFTLDCSGVTPSISATSALGFSTALAPSPIPSSANNTRHFNALFAGSTLRILGGYSTSFDSEVGASSIKFSPHSAIIFNIQGVVGASASESWLGGGTQSGTVGFSLQRVELAA